MKRFILLSIIIMLAAASAAQTIAGDLYTCHVKGDGTVWCWGEADNGRLGDGTDTDWQTPHAVSDTWNPSTALAAASAWSNAICAALSDGTAWCWGYDSSATGKMGDGGQTDNTVPAQWGAVTDVLAIDMGGHHSCAVRTAGAYCAGRRNLYRMGNGNDAGYATTPEAVTDNWSPKGLKSHITVGDYQACIVTDDGLEAWCWGSNGENGLLGAGDTATYTTPVQVQGLPALTPGVLEIAEIAAAQQFTCARLTDGTVWCWGYNAVGQLGDNMVCGSPCLAPVQVHGVDNAGFLTTATALDGGQDFMCALLSGGTVACWGHDDYGQLGNDDTILNTPYPTLVDSITSATDISAGYRHACALKSDGTSWCWGYNHNRHLGQTTNEETYATPVQVRCLDDTLAPILLQSIDPTYLAVDGRILAGDTFDVGIHHCIGDDEVALADSVTLAESGDGFDGEDTYSCGTINPNVDLCENLWTLTASGASGAYTITAESTGLGLTSDSLAVTIVDYKTGDTCGAANDEPCGPTFDQESYNGESGELETATVTGYLEFDDDSVLATESFTVKVDGTTPSNLNPGSPATDANGHYSFSFTVPYGSTDRTLSIQTTVDDNEGYVVSTDLEWTETFTTYIEGEGGQSGSTVNVPDTDSNGYEFWGGDYKVRAVGGGVDNTGEYTLVTREQADLETDCGAGFPAGNYDFTHRIEIECPNPGGTTLVEVWATGSSGLAWFHCEDGTADWGDPLTVDGDGWVRIPSCSGLIGGATAGGQVAAPAFDMLGIAVLLAAALVAGVLFLSRRK